jgi:predicted NBD/HSP70 family sugar kinase
VLIANLIYALDPELVLVGGGRECAKLWAAHAERTSWVWSATGRKPLCQ